MHAAQKFRYLVMGHNCKFPQMYCYLIWLLNVELCMLNFHHTFDNRIIQWAKKTSFVHRLIFCKRTGKKYDL